MKKFIAIFGGGLGAFLLSLLLILSPLIAGFTVIVYPITATVDFVSDIIGDVSDLFNGQEPSLEDMDMLIEVFYSKTEHKETIDKVVEKYPDNFNVSAYNLLKPFIYSQCNQFNEATFNQVASFINKEMPLEFDNEKMINYMLSTEPFKSTLKEKEIDKETLVYLFNGSSNKNEGYVPQPNAQIQEKIIGYAKSKLGARYWWGANGPTYFDCSGFIYWTHNQAGIKLPRTTAEGYSKMGYEVPFSQIQVGDVITFDYGSGVAHIGIYIGNNQMIHASGQGSGTTGQYPNQCVKITSIKKGSYFYRHLHNCRRLY